ncbi:MULTISPECIES: endonuclease domain-containing protein [unclassified Brevundimonas]|uniref:endonuclease domain-containing protein n=1 Tax=unclassified Brevundimonas TaxID=2622653 RepID=UPI003F92BAA8
MADSMSHERARNMRRALTPPEAQLWAQLKGRKLEGLKFRRQHPIGPYILDFYCAERELAVEVDGMIHDDADQVRHDERRTAWLAAQGVSMLRVASCDVRNDVEGVLNAIRNVALKRKA